MTLPVFSKQYFQQEFPEGTTHPGGDKGLKNSVLIACGFGKPVLISKQRCDGISLTI